MPEGVTPDHLRDQPAPLRRDDVAKRCCPTASSSAPFRPPFLDEITVVDTPGTNAIIREHEALTQRFVPRADLVLFVTSADRPFTESERSSWQSIREWGKKITVIINKIDLIRTDEDADKVIEFVRENIERLLGFRPEVFPVSALLAQQAKALGDRNPAERDRLWRRAASARSSTYIFETLDEEGRIRLKLLSPLGIAEHLTDRYLKATNDRLAILADDVDTIQTIDRQLALYQEDMRRQFAYHLTRIENIIGRMNARGDEFFEDTIRLGRIFDLLNSDKIRARVRAQGRRRHREADRRHDQRVDRLDGRAGPAHLGSGQRVHRPPPSHQVRRGDDRRGRRRSSATTAAPCSNRSPRGRKKRSTATTPSSTRMSSRFRSAARSPRSRWPRPARSGSARDRGRCGEHRRGRRHRHPGRESGRRARALHPAAQTASNRARNSGGARTSWSSGWSR